MKPVQLNLFYNNQEIVDVQNNNCTSPLEFEVSKPNPLPTIHTEDDLKRLSVIQDAIQHAKDQTEIYNSNGTDDFLFLDDTFLLDNKEYKVIGFDVVMVEPDDKTWDITTETYYILECQERQYAFVISEYDLLDKVETEEITPIAPDHCIYAVKSQIIGTSEFNEEFKHQTEYENTVLY